MHNRDNSSVLIVLGDNARDYFASLHRVAYYVDYAQSTHHPAHLMGLRAMHEG